MARRSDRRTRRPSPRRVAPPPQWDERAEAADVLRDCLKLKLTIPAWVLSALEVPGTDTPLTAEEMERRAAESVVRWHEEMYGRTKNPLHCWFAYADCRTRAIAIPEWVLRYLDGPARHFTTWARKDGRPPRPAAPAIAEALHLKRRGRDSGRGGAGDPFSDFHLAMRDLALAEHARAYVTSGHKKSLAPEAVACAWGNTVSPETVKRARKRFPPDTM